MKYCKKCKRMYNDSEQTCSVCKKKSLEEIKDKNTPVFLMSAGGFEKQRIIAALEDNGIPCDSIRHRQSTSVSAVLGDDALDADILVPYSAYEKAHDICIGIGAMNEGEESIVIDEDLSEIKSEQTEEFEEMSPAKRTTVKIVSALLLILLFAAVIYGVDFLTGLIKGLLS